MNTQHISITLTKLEWQVLADILSQASDSIRAAEKYMMVIEDTLDHIDDSQESSQT